MLRYCCFALAEIQAQKSRGAIPAISRSKYSYIWSE